MPPKLTLTAYWGDLKPAHLESFISIDDVNGDDNAINKNLIG